MVKRPERKTEPWHQALTIKHEGKSQTLNLKQIAVDYLRMTTGRGHRLGRTKRKLDEIKSSFALLRQMNSLKEAGASYADISRETGVPVSTVKGWLTLKQLPRELSFSTRKAYLERRTRVANTMLRDNSKLYLVGARFAGLNVSGRRIRVTKQHKRVAENVALAAGRITRKKYGVKSSGGKHTAEIGSAQLVQEINKLTNHGKRVPRQIITGPVQRNHLVRGFVDMRAIVTSREQNLQMVLNNEPFKRFLLRELDVEKIKYNYNEKNRKLTITRANLPGFFKAFGIKGNTLIKERLKR